MATKLVDLVPGFWTLPVKWWHFQALLKPLECEVIAEKHMGLGK